MIEGICAWIFLISGIITDDRLMFIASGAFAIATQISRIVDKMG